MSETLREFGERMDEEYISIHAKLAMLDSLRDRLIESMADFLDDESTELDQAIAGISDPVNREESELHIRMATAAMAEYIRTVLPGKPVICRKDGYFLIQQ